MISVHGERYIRRRVGVVGDFCPFCRSLRSLDAFEVRRVHHANYIPMGRSKHVFTELVCAACNSVRDVAKDQVQPVRRPPPDLADLVARTSAASLDSILARVDLEDRFRSGKTTPDERVKLLCEPFEMLEYAAQARRTLGGEAATTVWMLAPCIVLFGFFWQYVIAYMAIGHLPWDQALMASLLALALIGLGYWIVRGAIVKVRRYRRCSPTVPALGRALAPLRPTRAELDRTLATLRGRQSFVAADLTPERLQGMLTRFELRRNGDPTAPHQVSAVK